MNGYIGLILKVIQKACYLIGNSRKDNLGFIDDADQASQLILNTLEDDRPCMIARFGSTELSCICNFLGVQEENKSLWNYFIGMTPQFWWEPKILVQMQNWSGFYPPTIPNIERFSRMMLSDMANVDILGSWLQNEKHVQDYLGDSLKKVHLRLIEPFWAVEPWTLALKDKKVLVIHPFADDIKSQYTKRSLLFKHSNLLPNFKSLQVIQAVQSLGTGDQRFVDWFEALDFMIKEIDKSDYEICLIGAGAYGFPLAAHVKRSGKKSVHMGGSLQLLFGIKGKRWEDPFYGVEKWGIPVGSYSNLINEYWIRPADTFKPESASQVEGACYW